MAEIEEYYDEKAKNYDDIFNTLYFKVYDAVTWKFLEPYLPNQPEAKILDAGGGTGRWSIRIASKGCRVVLMDCSMGMLDVAKERVEDNHLQGCVDLKKCSITSTGYADETFDMVLCEHALFLFKDSDALLRELGRVLKKGARLVVSAQNRYVQALSSIAGNTNPGNVERATQILTSEEQQWMTKHGKVEIYTHTPDEFRAMLTRNGFRVEKMVGKGVTMPLRIKQEQFMEKHFSQELLNQILAFEFAVCEKPDALALAGHLQAIAVKT
jgi:ubiquinone/menaquinone biosynthesis C-methylase UbiE